VEATMMRVKYGFALAFCLLITGVSAGCFVDPDVSEGGAPDVLEETETAESALLPALSLKTIMTHAKNKGLPCNKLVVAGAVAMAESGGHPDATNWNGASADCPSGSTDRGIWQINDCYWPYSDACAFDPACNASAMATISNNGASWTMWAAYNNGSYQNYMSAAQQAYNAGITGCSGGGGGDVPVTAKCDDLGYTGKCVGKVSVWSENNTCKVRDCGAEGSTCGWISAAVGYGCFSGSGATTAHCGTWGYAGKCMSNTLVYAESGLCKTVNCSSTGRTCVYEGAAIGYNCK
jgi:hypothetical protein